MKKDGRITLNRTYFIPGWADTVILIALLFAGALAGSLLSAPILNAIPNGLELTELVSYPIMFIPPFLYAIARSRKSRTFNTPELVDRNGFGTRGGFACALAVIAGTLALAFVVDPVTNLLPPIPEFLEQALKALTQGNFLINFLCVSIMAPLCEEWLCRGTILRGLLGNGVKPVWAITASALVFAFIHLNPWQAIPAFTLGLLFGYVYWKTGSLKLTMLMHFTNNTFSLAMSRIPGLEDINTWMDVLRGPQYWIIFSACVIITALTVHFFHKIKNV